MSISKISFSGEEQLVSKNADNDGDLLVLEESYVVAGSARGLAEEQEVTLTEDKLVEFTFNDGTIWLSNADTIDDVFPEASYTARSGDGSFRVPSTLRGAETERGIVSDIALKLVRVFTKKTVERKVGDVAANLEAKMLENQSGLYRVDASFVLTKASLEGNKKPFLLFLHGTASSSAGSFKELTTTNVWKDILAIYGSNILAFQHESLTKSPLRNAAELVGQLPAGVELHLVSHSRGGLIGDILSRFCNSNENKRGFDETEKAYLKKTGRTEDLLYIKKLEDTFAKKQITISRFVRVACPANGTILASKRLDNFLNITLNLIGFGSGIAASPVYGAFKNLIATVVDTKNSTEELPGLEAMNPDSPFIKVLNSPDTTIEVDNPLIVISGNCRASLNFKALLIIASKLFYLTDNDLVVNTLSMYQGSRRTNSLTYLFDDLSNVDHFHYFKNEKTSAALLAALRSEGDLKTAGFRLQEQRLLAQGERNAIINAEGGSVFTEKVTGARPIAVLLPGIMGSNLAVGDKTVWINYWQFLKGGLGKLTVNENAKDGIVAPSLVGTSYKRLVQHLALTYDVVTFPYDWRRPLTESAALFNDKITQLLTYRQPIKIIGHSMGGVLVRDFIIGHSDTWKKLNSSKDFRLVFLGSPLGGSFRIPAVLFGQDPIIGKLAKIDLIHTKKELLEIFSKFKGLLSLLPLATTEDDKNDFSKASLWELMKEAIGDDDWPLPIDKGVDMAWFKKYYTAVRDNIDKIDYTNMVYIAGKDKATPCGYQINTIKGGKEKELVFLSTGEGDQSVTWETGIPSKMIADNSVYYVNVTHGALANEPNIFEGIGEILAKGATSLLSKSRPVVRGSEKVFKMPEVGDFDLSERGVERTLLGMDTQGKDAIASTENFINISVSNCHLKYAAFPVIAGHFAKDGILNAESEVDKMLGGALSERHRLNLYPGDIGTSEVVIANNNTTIKGGIIVGLGNFGELTSYLLTKTIEQGISKYLLDANSKLSFKNQISKQGVPLSVSTLIIGSSYGGLTIEGSVRAILLGIQNANIRLGKMYNNQIKLVEHVEIVEVYEDRALECFHALNKIEKDLNQPLKIQIPKKEIRRGYGSRKRTVTPVQDSWWTRITVSLDKAAPQGAGRRLRFSVSSGGAREEQKDLYINPAGIESMITDSSVNNLWSPRLAKALFEVLIPVDFKEQLKRQSNINWILDKDTAGYPWELLQDNLVDARPISVNAGMVRQLGTKDYRQQINAVVGNNALIIAAPALDDFLPALPGAIQEGQAVEIMVAQGGFEVTALIKSKAREILQELHSGYKIIHMAGHGVFNMDVPEQSGMVIGKNNYLTSADIGNMSTVPELVFINCCHLGQVSSVAEMNYQYAYKMAANIGTQLIENGVRAVVAAGWAVHDGAALLFAKKFYQCMFEGDLFGNAIRKARQAIYQEFPDTNTWGAYQCYGDPYYKLRDNRQTKKQEKKEYVIAEEAEIDLNNLYSEIKAGNNDEDALLDLLWIISKAVDDAGIRNADITELEGLIYADMCLYDKAIAKFRYLLTMEQADFSVSTLEKYSSVRMKKYVADYLKLSGNGQPTAEQITEWQQNADETIAGIKSLLQISPTAERYNLLGNSYKRKGILYGSGSIIIPEEDLVTDDKKADKRTAKTPKKEASEIEKRMQEKLQAYKDSAYNYMKAATVQKARNYAVVNWYALESILMIAEKDREWGKDVKHPYENYHLPSKEKVIAELKAISKVLRSDEDDINFWLLVEIPNCKLCLLIVEPDPSETQWQNLLEAYRQVWNRAGSRADKLAEIENLQLLSDALKLSDKKGTNGLQIRIDNLKNDLEKMM